MKSIDGSSKIIRLIILMTLSTVMIASCYVYHNFATYKSIKVVVNNTTTVEYGKANYNINDIIKDVEGEIVSVKQDVDLNTIGAQEVIIEVKKDSVVREVPIVVEVIDSVAPVIKLKEEKITIEQGDFVNLASNVESVNDEIDGDLGFLEEVTENSNNYYSVDYSDDLSEVGTHEIKINAVDKSGNISSQVFTLEVVEPTPVVTTPSYVQPVYNNLPANIAGGDIVSVAYSLLGAPYVYGTHGPYTFDCSGFVHYVYSTAGIYVSPSSSGLMYSGNPISYESAQPGDILLWGYSDGAPTHAALYVGNGQMIHAANSGTGVILSDVAWWTRGSGTHVISVRRVN